MKNWITLFAAALLVSGVLAGCGPKEEETTTEPPAAAGDAPATNDAAAGTPPPANEVGAPVDAGK